MRVPTETYHRIMLVLFDLSENAKRYVTLSELRHALPELTELDEKELSKYRGTKRLAAALDWLCKNGFIEVSKKGKLNRYKPKMMKHQYLQRLMEELGIKPWSAQ